MKSSLKQKKQGIKNSRDPKTSAVKQQMASESGLSGGSGTGRLIFGISPILEALRAENRRVEKILYAVGGREKRFADILLLARRSGVRIQQSSREDLSSMFKTEVNHQGIVALVAARDYVEADSLIEHVSARPGSLTLILDGVEDPRNLGAILRVAECAGVDAVFIPERRAAGLTETVAKSSAGAVEYVNIARVTNLNRLIEQLKEHNIWVIGSDGGASMNYDEWDWTQSTALVLGSEGKGLHRLTAEKCDALVKIPMKGRIESLNVSVAAGVILFEAVRQRDKIEANNSE